MNSFVAIKRAGMSNIPENSLFTLTCELCHDNFGATGYEQGERFQDASTVLQRKL
jgi:hypothetical protein